MKKNGAAHALLTPAPQGWRLRIHGGEDRTLPGLEEAVAALPAGTHLELALPCHAVLLERHKLPATDRAELADMLQIQLEKTLPFPVEEVSHGFDVIEQQENESTVLAVAAHHGQLSQLCAPLREKGRLPERVTLHAMRVAAGCTAEETVLALWPELEHTVVAIFDNRRLAWAQTISSIEVDAVMADLPGLLISAEIDGVPTRFQRVFAPPELRASIAEHLQQPVQPLPELPEELCPDLDLLPAEWQREARQQERAARLKQNLLFTAVVYLLLLAGAFIYLAWLKRKEQQIVAELAAMRPRFAGIEKQIARWDAFAPAIDPKRYPVEVLHQLTKNWAQDESLKFTSFTYSPREWIVKGESTTDAHFTFTVQRLKKDTSLETFEMTFPPTQNLKDDKVTFSITGKPR